MLHLTSGPAMVVEIGLAIFCFIDVLIAPEAAARWIPRWAWALFLLAFPLCASILWIFAGRSWRSRIRGSQFTPAVVGVTTTGSARMDRSSPPDGAVPCGLAAPAVDCTESAADLQAVDAEHEQTLLLWEADLRRREEALRAATRRTDGA
jgi:hypothetical protein